MKHLDLMQLDCLRDCGLSLLDCAVFTELWKRSDLVSSVIRKSIGCHPPRMC